MADGITYGPSVSRYTRVPINYSPGAADETLPDSPILKFLPFLSKIIPSLAAHSTVNSDSPNPSMDARHEDIHNLMNQLFGDTAPPVTQQQKDVLSPSLVSRDTSAGVSKELPAYMGAFVPSETPAAQDERDKFVKDFTDKLKEVSAKGADIYKKLSR